MLSGDGAVWAHIPTWVWPVIVAGVVGFFTYEALRASQSLGGVLRSLRRAFRRFAPTPRKVLAHIERIEAMLAETMDRLDCATAYLIEDADYHHSADIIIAECYPGLTKLLPRRISYSDFVARWKKGWRPAQGRNEP